VVVDPVRVAGAREAIQSHGAEVLVLDDGFQHRRLARDLDLVAVDATRPFGRSMGGTPMSITGVPPVRTGPGWPCDSWAGRPCYGRVLPAGLLREPVTGLRRAQAVVLTRCDQVPEDMLNRLEEEIRQINRQLVIARSVHAPVGIRTAAGAEIGLDQLRGMRLFAFCGIGNPQSFFHTIERLGGVLVGSRVFADHYRYTGDDLHQIHREAAEREASLILTTQKDWTKVAHLAADAGDPPLAHLAVELQMIAGAEALTALLRRVLDGRMPPS